ncbi:hypothetical protein BDZ94DRAFT_1256018 [Collybia nuda]|uniref:Uncharacterized protein n=1 Tax=Collybia nuda TaxID=64659 RepID=A0A9P5Y9C1_9AGAR|nr:hypothetical protein BDZ94DRAFT_1256018 [Collybia nuda]
MEEAQRQRETYQSDLEHRLNTVVSTSNRGEGGPETAGLEMLRLQIQQINITISTLQRQANENPPPDYSTSIEP